MLNLVMLQIGHCVTKTLKERADKRLHGAGSLLNDLYQMLQNGYTTSDFVHKHHLNSHQMKHLLSIFREEAADSFRQSA